MNKNFKKGVVCLAVMAVIVLMSGVARAGEWRALPVSGADYVMNPTLSLKGGLLDPSVNNVKSGAVLGMELAFNCPMLQTPVGQIRQQVSYNSFNKDDLKLQTIEFNPHWMVNVIDNLSIGGGPGLGYVWATADMPYGKSNGLWAFQLGVSAHYNFQQLFVGVESRYQITETKEVALDDKGVNNWMNAVKVGFNF